MLCFFSSFFFHCSRDHRDLHSFPTRRSSDLRAALGTIQRDGGTIYLSGTLDNANGNLNLNTVAGRSEEHTSELQSLRHLVCRLLLEKKKKKKKKTINIQYIK